jgi:2-polyprenyl-3-methyl-5-hydroxy-6-metoxy-1,4-benzoquinol methylase
VPGYQVKVQRVAVAGGDDLEVRSLLDRLQYSDPDGIAALAGISPASWPLFGQVWPSAQVLADLMQTWELGAGRVLEIGCGLALASMVIHRRLGDVTASDCHPLAESFLQDNLRRNRLPPMKYSTGNWTRANPQLGDFDLIIGSDVLYERDHPQVLADFIGHHTARVADVVIIDPNRGNRRAFVRCMGQHGFAVEESRLRSLRQDGSRDRGHLLHFRRGARI